MKLSLTKKFMLLLLPLAVVGVAVVTLTWKALSAGSKELAAASQVAQLALRSQYEVSEMGSSLKGFILEPTNMKEYDNKKKADDNNVAVLTQMGSLINDDDLKNLLGKISEFDEDKLNPAENKVLDLVKTGKHQEGQTVFIKEYLPLRNEYADMITEMIHRSAKLSTEKTAEIESQMISAAWTITISVCVGLSLIGFIIMWMAFNLKATLNQIISQLVVGAKSVNDSARSISEASETVSNSTVEQSAAVQQTVAAVEQINATVSKSSENATSSQQISAESSKKASQGQSAASDMRDSMNDIKQSNERIIAQIADGNREVGKIINLIGAIEEKTKVINNIVFQTKLLSFNASVEAARAGEAGKGFAVVAEEVGSLAQVSGVAAKEISDMLAASTKQVMSIIDQSQEKIEVLLKDGDQKVNRGEQTALACKDLLSDLNGNVNDVTDKMSQISEASKEQSVSINEISKAIRQIDSMTRKLSSATQGFSETSRDLSSQSDVLFDVVEELQATIEGTNRKAS